MCPQRLRVCMQAYSNSFPGGQQHLCEERQQYNADVQTTILIPWGEKVQKQKNQKTIWQPFFSFTNVTFITENIKVAYENFMLNYMTCAIQDTTFQFTAKISQLFNHVNGTKKRKYNYFDQ